MILHDVLFSVFSLLDVRSWAYTQLICKEFYEVCRSNFVMRNVLTLENASKTWEDFIAFGKTDKDHIKFLEKFMKRTFEEQCICLNPFKGGPPPYLFWVLEKDIRSGNWTYEDTPMFMNERWASRLSRNLCSYPVVLNSINGIVLNLFIEKRAVLSEDIDCGSESLQNKLRMNLLMNIQTKLAILNIHSWKIKTRLDKEKLIRKCFRGHLWTYFENPAE